MPLYNTATRDGFTRQRPASGTNIHTAYSTIHVATSVTVAVLHISTSGIVWTRMYLCSGGCREVFEGLLVAAAVVEGHRLPFKMYW